MNTPPTKLQQARLDRGWRQSQTIAAMQRLAIANGHRLPGVATLKAELSMFENGRRYPSEFYRAIFREIYRATNEDLGFTRRDQPPDWSVGPPPSARSPIRIEPGTIACLEAILYEQRRLDSMIGPQYLIPAVQSQLPLVEQLCRIETNRFHHHDLLRIAAHFHEFCGWLYQDSGNYQAATGWTNKALDYAYEANDPRLLSYVLMRKSNIATEADEPGHGLGLANAALHQPDLTPRLRAVSLRQTARAFAALGEPNDCLRAIDRATEEIVASLEPSDDELATYCSLSYIEMEAGASWVQLGQPDKAIDIFRRGLQRWPSDQQRDHGLCLSRLATAYAITGAVEEACATGHQAVGIAQSTGSARIALQLAELTARLGQQPKSSTTSELRSMVRQLGNTTSRMQG